MLAEQAPPASLRPHLKGLEGSGAAGSAEHKLPCYLEKIIHHSGRRLRFKLVATQTRTEKFEQLESLLAADPHVHSARINRVAGCCVVQLRDDCPDLPLAWIRRLPVSESALVDAAETARTKLEKDKQQSRRSQAEAATEDDDKFVPTRIILPVSSLALALLAGPLSLPPLAVAGFILVAAHLSFKRAIQGLKEERNINVDFLDALAVTLHSLEGFLVGPAMMITMIEGGEAVRDATQRIAHSANTDLLASLQTDVRLLVDGGELIVPSTSLNSGDRISLFPGDQIPVDGVIESGEGSLDVVKLTGESVPRHAATGDEVLAGFILLEGSLIVETRAVGENTRVGQITSMIESAPVFDTRVGNVAGRVANRFVIPTLLLAGVSLLLSAGNIAQAASLLMFDLGTGLRVSVPTAIMAALSRAGSQGLLIRSGRALEQLVDVDVVVFDKTGTLTQGHPTVVHVDVIGDGDLQRLMQLAASAEQGLNHPVAEAVIHHGEHLGITSLECQEWDYRIGRGVAASIDGHTVLVGNAKLLAEENLAPPARLDHPELETATPVYLVVDNSVSAIIYAADALRPDSRQLVAELHRRGIKAHMLTGDVASVAHAVAKRLGLSPEEVHAEALPDAKAELVKQLSEQGHKVAFVGDGINDSAALAYADVSVSFASGSDLARETADIVLTNDHVSDLLVAQDLARQTFALVKQNIGIVGVPNLSALVLGTFLPVSPIAAVLLNNGSCLVAAANAMRVLGFRPRKLAEAPPLDDAADTDTDAVTATAVTAAAAVNAVNAVTSAQSKAAKTSGSSAPSGDCPSEDCTSEHPAASVMADVVVSPADLAKRLGVTRQTITSRKGRQNFSSWASELDPDGMAWLYCSKSKGYRQVA